MKKHLILYLLLLALCLSILTYPAMALRDDEGWFYDEDDGYWDEEDVPDDDYYVDEGIGEMDLKTTSAGIQFIKDREGYVDTPHKDVSQMSIGYGCSTIFAEKYGFSTDYMSREEADQLILYVIAEYEQTLDKFLDKYEITLDEAQYDALISFTFNVGKSWLNPDYRLASLLIDGDYTVNEFAGAMGIWCHVGKEIDKVLVDRRIREIKLFLYGAYELDDTYNKFSYLIFDGNGGSPMVDISFYLDGEPYGELYEDGAEHESEYFQGWYTEDGQRITARDVVVDSMTVYAQWGDEPMEEDIDLTTIFSDVKEDDWYLGYAADLYAAGVIEGFNDGTFRATRNVTTGEALKMIILAAGYEAPEPVASHWARNFLNMALEEGFIERGEITDLDVPISRGLMAKIAANALDIYPYSEEQPFRDTDDFYAWALYDYGISDGYTDGSFKPNGTLNRAELTAIVWRILENF